MQDSIEWQGNIPWRKITPNIAAGLLDHFRALDWKLYFTLVFSALLPSIYSTVRLHLLGSLPSDAGVNIASQAAWLGVAFEVLQELLKMPLYSILGSTIFNQAETRNKVKTGLLLLLTVFALTSSGLYIAAPALVKAMAQSPDLHEVTTDYIRIEIFGFFVQSVNDFLIIPMELMKLNKVLLISLLLKMILTVFLDILLLSSFSFSFKLGVQGVAYSSLTTNIVTFLLLLILLQRHLPLHLLTWRTCTFTWLRTWTRLGLYSGLDSLVRNLTYSIVILRSMNLLEEAGTYWTTNTFIWSYLLLPFLPLSEVLRVRVSTSTKEEPHSHVMAPFLLLTLAITLLWLVSIPGWHFVFASVLQVAKPEENISLMFLLLPFYIAFMFGHLLTSVLYALSRTDLIALKSVIGNIVIGSFFGLTTIGVLPLTLTSVSLIFGSGLLLGTLTALALYFFAIKSFNFSL